MCSCDACVSVCVSVCAQRICQSDQFETVEATDFKFDVHVSGYSPNTTRCLKNFRKGGVVRAT